MLCLSSGLLVTAYGPQVDVNDKPEPAEEDGGWGGQGSEGGPHWSDGADSPAPVICAAGVEVVTDPSTLQTDCQSSAASSSSVPKPRVAMWTSAQLIRGLCPAIANVDDGALEVSSH